VVQGLPGGAPVELTVARVSFVSKSAAAIGVNTAIKTNKAPKITDIFLIFIFLLILYSFSYSIPIL
jgi:hypothetical protein